MSAAESEAVQVDVSPSDVVGEGLEGEAAPSTASSSDGLLGDLLGMLQSTEPATAPTEAEGTFATGVSWHQHAEVGFQKATASRGTPAWLNLVMAVILGVAGRSEGTDESEGVETVEGAHVEGGGEVA